MNHTGTYKNYKSECKYSGRIQTHHREVPARQEKTAAHARDGNSVRLKREYGQRLGMLQEFPGNPWSTHPGLLKWCRICDNLTGSGLRYGAGTSSASFSVINPAAWSSCPSQSRSWSTSPHCQQMIAPERCFIRVRTRTFRTVLGGPERSAASSTTFSRKLDGQRNVTTAGLLRAGPRRGRLQRSPFTACATRRQV